MLSPDKDEASPDKLVITIEGAIDVATATKTAELLSTDRSIDVRIGDCIEGSAFVDLVVTMALANLVLTVIQVTIALDQRNIAQAERKKWSYDKVIEVVKNKMAAQEVMGFEVSRIEGYSNLEEANGMPCIVFVHEIANGNDFKIFVFMDKKSYVLKVQ